MDHDDGNGTNESDRKLLPTLHKASLFLCFLGSMCSNVLLLLVAGRQIPRLLIVPFVIWLTAPFAVLLVAHRHAQDYKSRTRYVLYSVTLVITVISLAIYSYQVNWPRQSTPALYWVAVPLASVVFLLITPFVASTILSQRNERRRTSSRRRMRSTSSRRKIDSQKGRRTGGL